MKKIFALVAYLFMIFLNTLANVLPINGITTGEVSDKYVSLFTPAGFTFSIWGLIYLLLGYHLVYLFTNKNVKASTAFILSSILNGVWIVAWHYDYILLSTFIIIALLITLYLSIVDYKKQCLHKVDEGKCLIPIYVYFSWVTIATIANVTITLVKLDWDRFGLSESLVTFLVLMVGTLIISITGNKLKSASYFAVGIWAFLGILFKHLSVTGWNKAYPNIIGLLILSIFIFLVFSIRHNYVTIKTYLNREGRP